jgi:hydroxypyruvate reductase
LTRGLRSLRADAAAILGQALEAADPRAVVARSLQASPAGLRVGRTRLRWPKGRVVLLAAGKAAHPMAAEAAGRLGRRLSEALVVSTAEPPARHSSRLRAFAAGHPLPDARGVAAATEVERVVGGLGADDLLLVLLSGGASALLPAPAEGLRLEDKARTTALLMKAGATIHELNAVRKHLSRLKGGGLARLAAPARVAALMLSDVVGDDLATIASGPVSPDPTTYAGALGVLRDRGVLDDVPDAVRARLEAGAGGRHAETPKPGDPVFARVSAEVAGSNRLSLEAAAREAARRGYRALVLTSRLEGEAREAARVLVSVLRECALDGRPARPPVCLLAGGETTVTVRGGGQGGRNQEMAVAAAVALAGLPVDAVFASLATDGVDGKSDGAGGVVDTRTLERAAALGLAPPSAFLAENDTRNFLGPLGDLIVTGPTGTNVMDVTLLVCSEGRDGKSTHRKGAGRGRPPL